MSIFIIIEITKKTNFCEQSCQTKLCQRFEIRGQISLFISDS
jgi:hypothetical protein